VDSSATNDSIANAATKKREAGRYFIRLGLEGFSKKEAIHNHEYESRYGISGIGCSLSTTGIPIEGI
jgi:hypothetical protein